MRALLSVSASVNWRLRQAEGLLFFLNFKVPADLAF
jgi:hypothetical protein